MTLPPSSSPDSYDASRAISGDRGVPRTELCNRIGQSQATVVLLVAPAGFGKTTVMSQLRKQFTADGVETYWLTAEPGDNDLQRFLAHLLEVFTVTSPAPPGGHPRESGSPLEVLDRFALSEHPYALFIDDAETLIDDSAWRLLREVADKIPPGSRLVIGSRQYPEMGLARLRAHEKLVELDISQLRFSTDEARELFAQRQIPTLSPQEYEALIDRTEGWAAALLLAAMALEHQTDPSRFIHRFSGSVQAVSDYLTEEVLGQQPAEIREFLLGTCVLKELTPALCQTLLPRLDSIYLLDRIAQANLFLIALDGESSVWRYHALFADFLRKHLQNTDPDLFTRLHLAASGWYEDKRQFDRAIDHSIEGGDHAYAVELLNRHAERFLREGRLRLLAKWFNTLPQDALRKYPLLTAFEVWVTAYTLGAVQAQQLLDRSGISNSEDPDVQAYLNALRPLLLALRDRVLEAYTAACQSMRHLPTPKFFPDQALKTLMGHLAAAINDREGAARLLDEARRDQGEAPFLKMYIESVEGELDLQEGLLRQATARFKIALNLSSLSRFRSTRSNAYVGVLFAYSVYEANRLDEAEQMLRVYLPIMQSMGLQDHEILCSLMLSRIALQHDDQEEASRLLLEMEGRGYRYKLPRLVATSHLERARQLTLAGQASKAGHELERADMPEIWSTERKLRRLPHACNDLLMGQLRWGLHFKDPQLVLPQVEAELSWSRSQHRHLRGMTLRLLRSVLLHRMGDVPLATEKIKPVLRTAAEQGFKRLVLDEGSILKPVLRALNTQLQQTGGSNDPVLQEYLHSLLENLAALPDPTPWQAAASASASASAPIVQLEPLTPKELGALHLLAEGCSNIEMAQRLGVSDSTVRTHLRNINAKLQAQSRTQAVARARALGLLH